MNKQVIKKNYWVLLLIPLFATLVLLMCMLSSIFFKTYLKTLFHVLGISQFLQLSEHNTYPLTVLLLFTGLFIFVLIRHNIVRSLVSFLIFIASYGLYGYLFATIHALHFFTKPLLPSLLIAGFLGATLILGKLKRLLDIHSITPGMQNLVECSLWTGIFLVASKAFYPKIRPELIKFTPFTWLHRLSNLSEASIFFIFFIICLSALTSLVILQSPRLYTMIKRC